LGAGGGGGGGWYGGGASAWDGAGGGSGWVNTQAAYSYWLSNNQADANQYELKDSRYHLLNTTLTHGDEWMPNPRGKSYKPESPSSGGTVRGNTLGGFVRIVYIGR
jgi:hypothetical protein